MWLIVDQLLATGFIPINAWQQRASLTFKPGVLDRKAFNNDDITLFSVLTFGKPKCDNVLCFTIRAARHYHTWAYVNTWKSMFYPLNEKYIYVPLYPYVWGPWSRPPYM